MSGYVQARDVEPGMFLEMLTYDGYDRPLYLLRTVVHVKDADNIKGDDGTPGKIITWDDTHTSCHGPTDRFIDRRN